MNIAAADANIPHADIYGDAWAAADDANAYDADVYADDEGENAEGEEHGSSQ